MDRYTIRFLVRKLFIKITGAKNKSKTEISPLVKSLSGVIKSKKDFDYKKEYGEYLASSLNKHEKGISR